MKNNNFKNNLLRILLGILVVLLGLLTLRDAIHDGQTTKNQHDQKK
jgi:hypothetical protein